MDPLPRLLALLCPAGSAVRSAPGPPRVELDHLFIVVRPGAVAEAAALRSAGLTVGSRTARHDGQGTASVVVFFENAYLELIWVDDSVSVDAELLRHPGGGRAITLV